MVNPVIANFIMLTASRHSNIEVLQYLTNVGGLKDNMHQFCSLLNMYILKQCNNRTINKLYLQ